MCDANALPPPLFAPQAMCAPPQDMFFIGDDLTTAAESSRLPAGHASFFGADDMGSVSEHELKWDDFSIPTTATTNAFSTTDMLCRQASDGADDLAALFFYDENRVVF